MSRWTEMSTEERARASERQRAYHQLHKHDPEFKDRRRQWVINNRDKRRAYEKKYIADPARWVFRCLGRIKYRAKKSNLEFDLSIDDLIIPKVCPVLGIPIKLGAGGVALGAPNAPSVDRFNNELGYTRANIRIISNRANLLKRDATLEEMKKIVAYMEGAF